MARIVSTFVLSLTALSAASADEATEQEAAMIAQAMAEGGVMGMTATAVEKPELRPETAEEEAQREVCVKREEGQLFAYVHTSDNFHAFQLPQSASDSLHSAPWYQGAAVGVLMHDGLRDLRVDPAQVRTDAGAHCYGLDPK